MSLNFNELILVYIHHESVQVLLILQTNLVLKKQNSLGKGSKQTNDN